MNAVQRISDGALACLRPSASNSVFAHLSKLGLGDQFVRGAFNAAISEVDCEGLTVTDIFWATAYARYADTFEQAFSEFAPTQFSAAVHRAAQLTNLTVNEMVFRVTEDVEVEVAETVNQLAATIEGQPLAAVIVTGAGRGLINADDIYQFGWTFPLVSQLHHLSPSTRIRHIVAAAGTSITPEQFSWLERVGIPLTEAHRLASLGADSPELVQRAWRMGWPDHFILPAASLDTRSVNA